MADALAAGARAEAEMVDRLADRLIHDAAGSALVLVGWSMGGMLAAELALALSARGQQPQMLHVAGMRMHMHMCMHMDMCMHMHMPQPQMLHVAGRMAPGSFITYLITYFITYFITHLLTYLLRAYGAWVLHHLLHHLHAYLLTYLLRAYGAWVLHRGG